MDYFYTSYGKVDDIELEKNQFTMMKTYIPKILMAILTNKLEEGRNFVQAVKQYVTYSVIISKEITILKTQVYSQMA